MPIDIQSLKSFQAILTALYAARLTLATSPYAEVTIDGQQVRFQTISQLDESILFWERKVALLSNRRRRASTVDLTGF